MQETLSNQSNRDGARVYRHGHLDLRQGWRYPGYFQSACNYHWFRESMVVAWNSQRKYKCMALEHHQHARLYEIQQDKVSDNNPAPQRQWAY